MNKDFFNITWQQHRIVLIVILITLIVQFVLFKVLYPFPNFMPDSESYVWAAYRNDSINTWPIGYSCFLRIESAFTKSHIVLVLIQYIFLQFCIFLCLFRVAWFLSLGRSYLYVLASLFTLNPVPLLVSNYVAADALFTGGTLLWFCLLLELLLRPKNKWIWLQSILVVLLFTIRYNALFFPIVSIVVISFIKLPLNIKLKGVGLMLLLIGLFVWHNVSSYKSLTGKAQFSPFGGWMLAGDALFMYSRLPRDKKLPPTQFVELHRLVDRHMDSLESAKVRPDSVMGIYYIWNGPLRSYQKLKYEKQGNVDYFKQWATMGSIYQDYGRYLIMSHPWAYSKYFLLPNIGYYFSPPAEFLNIYNQGRDSTSDVMKSWFGLKNKCVKSYSKRIDIAGYVSVLNTLFNILFGGGLFSFFMLRGFSFFDNRLKITLLLALFLILVNFVFSVTLAPIVLRYQIFSFTLTGIFSAVLINSIYLVGKYESLTNNR